MIFLGINFLFLGILSLEVMTYGVPGYVCAVSRVPEAKQYFDGLPLPVQDKLRIRPNGIKSLEDLKRYAGDLMASGQ